MPDIANIANITISYIRGELIIPNDKWKASMGTNARNTVAGVVNAKILNQSILNMLSLYHTLLLNQYLQ